MAAASSEVLGPAGVGIVGTPVSGSNDAEDGSIVAGRSPGAEQGSWRKNEPVHRRRERAHKQAAGRHSLATADQPACASDSQQLHTTWPALGVSLAPPSTGPLSTGPGLPPRLQSAPCTRHQLRFVASPTRMAPAHRSPCWPACEVELHPLAGRPESARWSGCRPNVPARGMKGEASWRPAGTSQGTAPVGVPPRQREPDVRTPQCAPRCSWTVLSEGSRPSARHATRRSRIFRQARG